MRLPLAAVAFLAAALAGCPAGPPTAATEDPLDTNPIPVPDFRWARRATSARWAPERP